MDCTIQSMLHQTNNLQSSCILLKQGWETRKCKSGSNEVETQFLSKWQIHMTFKKIKSYRCFHWLLDMVVSSALKSSPVQVFCHFGGGLEPDRSTIKGNSQKTRPRLKKTPKNWSKPVQTSLCKDHSPDWSKLVMPFFFWHPLMYCHQNTQKSHKSVQN